LGKIHSAFVAKVLIFKTYQSKHALERFDKIEFKQLPDGEK